MKSPAFSFYVRDWLCSKTVSKLHSKPSSKGVSSYLFLLCSAWLEDPPATLPDDDHQLAAYARLSMEEWLELKPDIIHQFPLIDGGRRANERLMSEWKKQQHRKSAGSKGGSKKVANAVAALEDEVEVENEDKSDKYPFGVRLALSYLNEKSGRSFREVDSNLKFISERMKEKGVTYEGVKQMIDRQCLRWIGTDQEEYLRPETLFNRTKFDGYYAAKDQPVTGGKLRPESKEMPEHISVKSI